MQEAPPNDGSLDRAEILRIVGPDYVNRVLFAYHHPAVEPMRQKSIEDLIECLDLNPNVHLNAILCAVQELGVRGDHSAIIPLASKLRHPSYRMRQEVFMAICMIECVDQPKQLIQKMLDTTRLDEMNPILSLIALAALNKVGLKGGQSLVDLETVEALLAQDRVAVDLADETNINDAEYFEPFQPEDAPGILQAHLRLRMDYLEQSKLKTDSKKNNHKGSIDAGPELVNARLIELGVQEADRKKVLAVLANQKQDSHERLRPEEVITNLKRLSSDPDSEYLEHQVIEQALAHPDIKVREEALITVAKMGLLSMQNAIVNLIDTEVSPDLIGLAVCVLESFLVKDAIDLVEAKMKEAVQGRLPNAWQTLGIAMAAEREKIQTLTSDWLAHEITHVGTGAVEGLRGEAIELRGSLAPEEDRILDALTLDQRRTPLEESEGRFLFHDDLKVHALIDCLKDFTLEDCEKAHEDLCHLLFHRHLDVKKLTLFTIFKKGYIQASEAILGLIKTETDARLIALAICILDTFGKMDEAVFESIHPIAQDGVNIHLDRARKALVIFVDRLQGSSEETLH